MSAYDSAKRHLEKCQDAEEAALEAVCRADRVYAHAVEALGFAWEDCEAEYTAQEKEANDLEHIGRVPEPSTSICRE